MEGTDRMQHESQLTPDGEMRLPAGRGTPDLAGQSAFPEGSEGTGELQATCAFCRRDSFAANILRASTHFLLVADYAPLVEGHLLIIPRRHYACYGAMPAALDGELYALKQEVQHFFNTYYAASVYWEHGVFRQTVFHAHLHCFPFGNTHYAASRQLHSLVVRGQDDLRDWYTTHGHYFSMQDTLGAYLFAPEIERYMHVVQNVLTAGVAARGPHGGWRSQQQRYAEGAPLIQATRAKWRQFLQQETHDANDTATR
jgi:diadenosine tetraphosphate (Ap4A) HIT family hydrolase